VKLLGEEIDVQLEIYDLKGFSGHADQRTILDWLDKFNYKPKKIFLVHGEEGPATTLRERIEERFGIECIIPNMGDKMSITKDRVEVSRGLTIDPILLQEDIAMEIENISRKIAALQDKRDMEELNTMVVKNYDELKNKLIDLKNDLMDLNILISK
ncbi:MAG: MBL fold metallo-hydrolase RNA specificity domain-containing protein, partial [Tissierellaceae bacterium]